MTRTVAGLRTLRGGVAATVPAVAALAVVCCGVGGCGATVLTWRRCDGFVFAIDGLAVSVRGACLPDTAWATFPCGCWDFVGGVLGTGATDTSCSTTVRVLTGGLFCSAR